MQQLFNHFTHLPGIYGVPMMLDTMPEWGPRPTHSACQWSVSNSGRTSDKQPSDENADSGTALGECWEPTAGEPGWGSGRVPEKHSGEGPAKNWRTRSAQLTVTLFLVSQEGGWVGRSHPGIGNRMLKGPKAERSLQHSRNQRELSLKWRSKNQMPTQWNNISIILKSFDLAGP